MTKIISNADEARALIAAAFEFDADALLEAVVDWNNTTDNEIAADGNVWVANPQTGHWLDDDKLIAFATFIA